MGKGTPTSRMTAKDATHARITGTKSRPPETERK